MIGVTIDTKPLQGTLTALERDQFPFAVSKALNDLAIRAADVQRADMQTRFIIRNPNVLKYGIVRLKSATKRDLTSAMGVSQQRTGSREAFGYLKKFEQGIRKVPLQGTTVGVPQDARRTKRGIVAASQRIPALQLRRIGNQVKGIKRTFMIQPKSGKAAAIILQAVGRGKRAVVRVLYVLKRSVPTKPILHLQSNAVRTARTEFVRLFGVAMQHALRTARRP